MIGSVVRYGSKKGLGNSMRKSFLRASAGLQTLALLGAGTAASFILPTAASAQDYTSGAISGSVTTAGKPVAGATVTVRNVAQNQTRTITTDGAGNFAASGLPAGLYDVNVNAPGLAPYSGQINIAAAQSTQANVVTDTPTSLVIVPGRIVIGGSTSISGELRFTATGMQIDLLFAGDFE